ncbi:MAG: CotH kinase family protein, partial [Muribaculaceae bacterium]|nr:CotH kinase family protein [Muribaculaceae bacterium]
NARYNVRKLEEVTVSIPEGVSLPSDTRLYVTTDGSEPTIDSPSYDKEFTVRSSQSMIVRAKLISAEALSPRATTHSYIYHSRDVNIPVVALNTNQEYLDDEKIGIWQNFNNDWRRPVNVEYFYASGEKAPINQLGEFRIHGGWSRHQPQKSFVIYSHKRFGTKKYSYPFWTDKPDIKKSKSFVMRNGGNCFGEARINDSFVQTLFGRNCENLDWQAYRPAICYFNGKYRGLYALRQRSNEDYVEDCYDGLEDIDMLENWEEVKAGSDESFKQLRSLYESNPSYAQMEKAIDVENFANLFIANAWAANTDFPGNNIVMWRPTAEGGKWRWIMKDLDFLASNPTNFNYFDFMLLTGSYANNQNYANSHAATKLFRVMTNLKEFREPFIDRFFVYLGDFLRPAVTAELIDEQRDELAPEYTAHLACYGNPIDYNGWVSRVKSLKKWCAERSEAMPEMICNYFKLGNPLAMNIDGAGHSFSVNDIAVNGEMFEGKWPARRGVTVKSDSENIGWKVTLTQNDGTELSYDVPSKEFSIVPGENLSALSLSAYETSGVGNVIADEASHVSVNICSDLIVVEADASIDRVTVTDITGRMVACERPLSVSAQVSLSRGGVYVVEVVLADGQRVVRKVML